MIESGELESGIPQKIGKLESLLSIKPEFIARIKEWISQIQFCLTIHPHMNVSQG